MDHELTYSVDNGSEPHNNPIYRIGNKGNQIELYSLDKDSYRLICRSVDEHHQYQTHIVYSMNKNEVQGLADFLNYYLENK